MKTPADYLTAAWQPTPDPWPADGIPHVPQAQAERAIGQALADAEKYRLLLAQAIRHSHALPPSSHEPQPL